MTELQSVVLAGVIFFILFPLGIACLMAIPNKK